MVGVPGHSKGCNTCRKRKIACSLEKPQCVQCIKSNRVCAGYARARIFIVSNGPTETSQSLVRKEACSSKKSRGATYTTELQWSSESGKDSASSVFDSKVHWSVIRELSPLAVFRQQLMGTFLSSHVPERMSKITEEKSWLQLLSELPSPSIALEKSTLAICTARLGRLKADEAMIRRSLRLYTEGLYELQKALYDPSMALKDETLGAVMSLATYELMECPAGSTQAYASHHKGCAELVQLRGVNAHTSGLGRQIFVSFRTQGIMNALDNHRSTYLCDPAWLTVPWSQTGKTHFDELLDILTTAPKMFHRVDLFEELEPQEKLLEAIGVIGDCWKIDKELQLFHDRFEASMLGPPHWPEYSKSRRSQHDGETALFPIAYQFPDFQTAKTLVLYWSILTCLWTGMTRLYQLASALAPNSRDLPALQHRAEFMVPARDVFQSVEFLMEDKMLGLGPQSLVAPLSIVFDTIKDFPDYACEVAWAEGVMDELRERGLRYLGCDARR